MLFVYSPDHPQHKLAVRHLANFMEERCGCDVMLDVHCLDEINRDKAGWLGRSVDVADSILLIASEGAAHKIKASNNQQLYPGRFHELERPLDDMFTMAYEHIKDERLRGRLTGKIILVKFDYTPGWSMSVIDPGLKYILPADLEKVCMRIYNVAECRRGESHFYHLSVQESDILTSKEHGVPLFQAINKMRKHVQENDCWFADLYDSGLGVSISETDIDSHLPWNVAVPNTPTSSRVDRDIHDANQDFDDMLSERTSINTEAMVDTASESLPYSVVVPPPVIDVDSLANLHPHGCPSQTSDQVTLGVTSDDVSV